MSAQDDGRTLGAARLDFATPAEIDEFVVNLRRFEAGEIGPDEWRTFRLLRGIYPQRQDGVSMVRAKIPQGVLTAQQLRTLAAVARAYSRGFGHITTRQNFQFHFVPTDQLELVLRDLASAGLTTREACGNSVRNITACPYSGVAEDEVFDVTPYAEAMTRFFLGHPLASALPRKFKIAWEGCATDHSLLGIHDIGFRAAVETRDGRLVRGFTVTVGGGTSTVCRSGTVLDPFLPASRVLALALALLRVFHSLGDFEHRKRNRLKFLVQALGWDRFRDEVLRALDAVDAADGATLPFDPEAPPVETAPGPGRPGPPSVMAVEELVGKAARREGQDYGHWVRTNVRYQRQSGYVLATVTVPLGDLTAGQLEVLAMLVESCGDGTLRTTSEQNVVLRWIRQGELRTLFDLLVAADLALADAESVADPVSCPGAESCRLAVTHSRGLARALRDHMDSRPDLIALAPELRLRVSGCPNGCGRHHVADIGFQGSVRKVGESAVTQYFLSIGGGSEGSGPGVKFAGHIAKIPARKVPEAVERLLRSFQEGRREGETAREFLRRIEPGKAAALLEDLGQVVPSDLDASGL